MRRVTVSSFRGKTMLSIREYYEKDGQALPGKKGISLPMDQFATLVAELPNIEMALKEHGESIPRPHYEEPDDCVDDSKVIDDNELNAEALDPPSSKKNIEATSDEDESEA
ncbi:hypothetical protein FE257_003441 [Aspergillus nanangensis]|uniref:Transcriptional coactivator p15 (PC4) C-terminal domain-containing protein n=1 Tax=Aspergillus nanangensis TaxID=2582783 RepID=A0AAD4CCR4_ASPNN|nr:hypothetical protein FE257_003441 [Aspergillus nanangensis]